jgi:hypothetical protein
MLGIQIRNLHTKLTTRVKTANDGDPFSPPLQEAGIGRFYLVD